VLLDLISGLRTTGAAREFTPDPVSDETLAEVLDDARFAPSGGNRQPWKVAVVKNPVNRRSIAELMTRVWHEYVGASSSGETPFLLGATPTAAPVVAPNALLDHIEDVPVVLVVAADLHRIALMDGQLPHRPPLTGGASVYPFCWSILLGARARGLGGVMTTFLSRVEPEAAEPLGLPDGHALAATIFLGHPVHQATRLRRQPVGSFTTIDRFDGTPLDG